MVLLFHAYARWADIYPFGSRFTGVPVFAYGMLGVQLFFMISGFVILMTLEKCSGFLSFMLKRWLRLFPAMLICSIFIFITAGYFPERPAGQPVLRDMLPGLSFIEPYVWSKLLHAPQGALEGVFWSLYIEVKFYVLFGLMYFVLGSRAALTGLALLFFASVLSGLLLPVDGAAQSRMVSLASTLLYWSGAQHFGWFAAGALYFRYFKHGKKWDLGLAVVLTCCAALAYGKGVEEVVAALVVVALFSLAITAGLAQKLCASPVLVWLGVISYPLYLLHENLMVAMIIQIGRVAPWLPAILIPLIPILIVMALAALVAQLAEPWLRQRLRGVIARVMPAPRTSS
ncbi:hypothetical protein GCM10011396_05670 [Undibacterium terreum]|uniref:Acyltransferase 3 domain-containing protein n=2 Tax=Undibacterium terreum TaxID=1224302 RepID=A0A916XCF6_9BURK|nr:hypothetical protein GCM10011396_05670 [Undibacterium terreum]